MSVSALSKLCFLKVDRYCFNKEKVFNFLNYPRPHYCIGLVLKGRGEFCEAGEQPVLVEAGELIFVPITTQYRSHWYGSNDIEYISFHACFEQQCEPEALAGARLQKVSAANFKTLQQDFAFAEAHYNKTQAEQLQVLSFFYRLLAELLPRLCKKQAPQYDRRIANAVEYMNLNLSGSVSVPFLAGLCHLSPSRFYECFKLSTGLTPVAYKNRACVTRATYLLIRDRERPIAEIAELLGFESDTYFRRVFKGITGCTPGHYRKSVPEV